jgi:exodeoxyribonuclease-3
MDSSLFKLTSLNLNGIRSATTKGVEAWIEATAPDCICVQEIKAQAPDIPGLRTAGRTGWLFPLCRKEGLFRRGRLHPPRAQRCDRRPRLAEFDAEGRYVEARFDTAGRKLSIISAYFPSGSSGEDRQQAKFRFWPKCTST